jgi:YD repeat-containing protein
VDGNGTAAGVTTSCTPPARGCATYGYDAFGNVNRTTDPLNHTSTAGYDADGDKVSVTDANNHTVITTFDPAGQATKVTQADGTAQVTDYNPDGAVADTIDGLAPGPPTATTARGARSAEPIRTIGRPRRIWTPPGWP